MIQPQRSPARLSGRRADLLSVVLMLGFFAVAMTQAAVPGLSTILREEFNLSAAQLGLLMSSYFITYGLIQVPAGALAGRWGGRVALAGFATIAAGDLLFILGSDFTMLIAARALQGLGAAAMLPTCGALITAHVSPERLGRGWSITGMGASFGNLFALAGLARLVTWGSLDLAFVSMLGLTVVGALLSARLPEFRHLPSPRPARQSLGAIARDVRTVLASRGVLLLAAINVAAISFGIGVVTWTPSYLHDVAGSSVTLATLLTGGYAVGQIVAAPLVGYLADRFGYVRLLLVAFTGMTLCGLSFLFLSSPGGALLLTAVVGVFMTASFAPSFALIPYHVELRHAGLTSGVISGIGFLGSMPAPWLVGLLLDAGAGYQAAYGVLTAFALLGLVASLLLGRLQQRRVSQAHVGYPASHGLREEAPMTHAHRERP